MSQTNYLQEQILNRLRMDNPWWITNSIDDYFQQMQRRLYLELFYPLVADTELRRGLLLMGPRRVGKTVMLYHTIQKLINKGYLSGNGQNLDISEDMLRVLVINDRAGVYGE